MKERIIEQLTVLRFTYKCRELMASIRGVGSKGWAQVWHDDATKACEFPMNVRNYRLADLGEAYEAHESKERDP